MSDQEAQAVEELRELVRIPSVTTDGAACRACAEWVRDRLIRAGANARLYETPGNPIVYGELIGAPEARTVLVYGHYDVQPAAPLDAWQSPPFELTARDGRLFGRGAGDNKGQILAQILGLERSRVGRAPRLNIKFLIEGEEESGSKHISPFILAHRDLLAADLAVSSDGPMHHSWRPTIVLGARGWMHVELRLKGAINRVHSGNFGGLVPSPVLSLVKLLSSMVDEHERVIIEGYCDDVASPGTIDREAMAKLPFDQPGFMAAHHISRMGGDARLSAPERLMFQPHINIAGIQSGYTGAGFQSSIPNSAFAKLDLHFVANQDPDRCLELLKRHIRAHCPDEVEVIRGGSMPPSRTPIDHPAVPIVFEALKAVWGEEPVVVPLLGGGLPDHLFTGLLQLPSLWVPYAQPDQANHAPNENIMIGHFLKGILVTEEVLRRLGTSAI